jgi:hypothetical protein
LAGEDDATEMVVASAPIMIHNPQPQGNNQQYMMVPVNTQHSTFGTSSVYAQSLSTVSMI